MMKVSHLPPSPCQHQSPAPAISVPSPVVYNFVYFSVSMCFHRVYVYVYIIFSMCLCLLRSLRVVVLVFNAEVSRGESIFRVFKSRCVNYKP
jgi:hypothetical protein